MKNNPLEQRPPILGRGDAVETGTTACCQRNKVDTPPQPGGDTSDSSDAGGRGASLARRKSSGIQQTGRRRRRIHQLEKEKLEMTSAHNQQLCTLEAELARLRSSVERGEAQRTELQYQLVVSQRDTQQARHANTTLTDHAAAIKQTVRELQKVLEMTQHARKEDLRALQQEVDERDALIDSLTLESERLHRLLQCQEEALEVGERRMVVLQKEREKDMEAALAVERRSHQEAQCKLEQLQGQLREAERERREQTERAQQRLQAEHEQCKSELSVALETQRRMTFKLKAVLEEEKRAHANTHLLLKQVPCTQSHTHLDSWQCQVLSCIPQDLMSCVQAVKREAHCQKALEEIKEAIKQHTHAGCTPTKDDGKQTPADIMHLLKSTLCRQARADHQVQDLQLVCERLHEEKQTLQELTVDQKRCLQESGQLSLKLQEEVARLRTESNGWSAKTEELEKEKEEMSNAHLSFLHSIHQRVLVGHTVLSEPPSTAAAFTRTELCDVINQQVELLISNVQEAKNKVDRLQSVCEEKSACMQELQRSHECVLAAMEERVRIREETKNSRHAHELQVNHCECRSLRDRVSSLTSDLSRLHDFLLRSRKKSSSFMSACALLAGATVNAELRVRSLCEQKRLLVARFAAREELEQELRRLAGALGGDEDERGGHGRRARRRWRKYACVLSALRRLRAFAKRSTVLFRVERGSGRPAVYVATATLMGQDGSNYVGCDGRDAACVRWLRSKSLSSAILSCMADLQRALASTPPGVTSAARSGLSRLLDQLITPPESGPEILDQIKLTRHSQPLSSLKILVSGLQQHFLLFSQRLHSAEVERRSLRLEMAQLRKAEQQQGPTCRTVPAQHFHSVCTELRQALSREQEAQNLAREQSAQLDALRLQVNTHAAEQANGHHALSHMAEMLAEVRRRLKVKERTLRVLAKRLSRAQEEKRILRGRLRRIDEQLQDANRPQDHVINYENAAGQHYKELTGGLIQSLSCPSAERCLLTSPVHHVKPSGTDSIMGACQVSDVQAQPTPGPHPHYLPPKDKKRVKRAKVNTGRERLKGSRCPKTLFS
ncbi:coiled-coil domain-containing protein 171-like isoform X2 [Nerophis ophidion]|uniref:coiled-coil domain-containing protein 171-like isoform X2 n=1 Tax=Nerophis ophidion TaxID=159077 RepID=UPI002ADFB9A0|nr:coiled-coil domain-containing protein 171-like isoform X2 [Nerophis ophidion]